MAWLPNWLTGLDTENLAQARAADEKLRQMNRAKYGPGGPDYDPYLWAQIEDNYARQDEFTAFDDFTAEQQVQAEFDAGLEDAAAGLVKGTRDSIGAGLWNLFRLIPLWVWLLGAVAVFLFYLGGLDLLRRKIKTV